MAQTFEHEISHIAVRIGVEQPGGNSSIGTGFLYSAQLDDDPDRVLILLVSNKHVFGNPDGKISINLNKKDDSGNPIYGNIKPFESTDYHKSFYAHPDLSLIHI